MNLDTQSLIVSSVIGVNLCLVLFFAYVLRRSISNRSRPLWKLVVMHGIVSTISILSFYVLMPTLSVLSTSTGVFYLLVGSFVLAIEVPGYIRLTKHDGSILNYLEGWRSEVVKLGYDFQNYDVVKSKALEGKGKLEEVYLYRLVHDFIDRAPGHAQPLSEFFLRKTQSR